MLSVTKEPQECLIPLLSLRTPRVAHPKAHKKNLGQESVLSL